MQKGWKVFSHLNGKSRKKLLACLLSISMIPVNGFTVMAATADQGNQVAVTQEGTTTPTVTSGISFAAESQNVTMGSFILRLLGDFGHTTLTFTFEAMSCLASTFSRTAVNLSS